MTVHGRFIYRIFVRGAGNLTIIAEKGGGVFANEDYPQDQVFYHFFKCQGLCPWVCPGDALGWN